MTLTVFIIDTSAARERCLSFDTATGCGQTLRANWQRDSGIHGNR